MSHDEDSAPANTMNSPATPRVIDPGVAGASALREHERQSTRDRQRKEARVASDATWREQVINQRRVLGRVVTALTPKPVIGPEPQSIRNWEKGGVGEERLGSVLSGVEEAIVLHDRRIPGSRGNIDHIAVISAGVFVIDAKNYDGVVEKRNLGGWFRSDERLFVNGSDRTKTVGGVHEQMSTVREILKTLPEGGVPVHGVLCFVGANWRPLLPRPLSVNGVRVMWPAKLVDLLKQPGTLTQDKMHQVATHLADALRPA